MDLEKENIEMISRLIEKCQRLEAQIDQRDRKVESLSKNLLLSKENMKSNKSDLERNIKHILRSSDLESEKMLCENSVQQFRISELEFKIKELKKEKYQL